MKFSSQRWAKTILKIWRYLQIELAADLSSITAGIPYTGEEQRIYMGNDSGSDRIRRLCGIVFFISIWESDTTFEIGILDETGVMAEALTELNAARYVDYSSLSADSLRSLVQQEEITGFIQMDEENIEAGKNLELIYSGSGGIQLLTSIRTDMREVIRQERLRRANVSPEIRQIYDASIQVDSRRLTRTGDEQDDDTIFLSIIGMIMGIVIFGAIFS